MLQNLKRVIDYCQTFGSGDSFPRPHIVADENQGTTVLNNPSLAGPQIIISMPMTKLSGNCDTMTGPHTFIIYTLEKAQDITASKCGVVKQYLSTVEMLDNVLEKFSSDIGGRGSSGTCFQLAGMELIEIEVLPAAGIFGGWNGYSATLTLR